MMERGPLQDASLTELSKTWVACRMTGGDENPSPGIDAFMARYGVDGFPTCLVLSADGALLKTAGNVMQPPEILAAARDGAAIEAEFQAFKKAVEKFDDPALWGALAKAHADRRDPARAVEVLAKLASKDPSPRRLEALARAQGEAGDHKAALASWDKLIAGKLSGPDSVGYRIARAKAGVAGGGTFDAALTELTTAAEVATKAGNPGDAKALSEGAGAVLWDEVVRLCNAQRKFGDAVKLLDRLLKDFGTTPAAANARQFEAQIRQMAGG